jgi:hypothetical protein
MGTLALTQRNLAWRLRDKFFSFPITDPHIDIYDITLAASRFGLNLYKSLQSSTFLDGTHRLGQIPFKYGGLVLFFRDE